MKLINEGKRTLLHLLIRLCWLFPINRNKVLIVNYLGKSFGDNGKAIALSLLKKRPELDIVWAVRPGFQYAVPEPIRCVTVGSLRYFWDLATAAVWIDNCRKGGEVLKRKGQYYIQTWHGNLGFKKIEQAVENHLEPSYVVDAKHDAKMTDLMLSGSRFFTELCQTIFWYDGEVMECGTPRLDAFYSMTQERKEQVKAGLGLPSRKRIILYAPTFRADYSVECYTLDFAAVCALLEQQTGEEWVVAVRLHPNVVEKADAIPYSDKVINASDYPDLYELIPAVDMVISDYSSLMFEAGMIKKPTFIFATDLADYLADRGFYFDIHEVPFPLAQNNAEMLERLRSFDFMHYGEAIDRFYAALGSHEGGTASDAVASKVLEVLDQR